MKFCYNLSDEVTNSFIPFEFKKPDNQKTVNIVIGYLSHINKEFAELLKRVGCYVDQIDIFYTFAPVRYDIHIDRPDADNTFAKINYVVGGKDSFMDWYALKEGKSCYWFTDVVGTKVRGYRREECDHLYRHHMPGGRAYLLDVGTPHDLTNPTEQRTCYSMFLSDIETKRKLSLEEARQRFEKYIVE